MKRLSLIFAAALLFLIASCGNPPADVAAPPGSAAPVESEVDDSFTPFPTPTGAELPTPTPAGSLTPIPSATPAATVTLEPPEPTPTATPTPSSTPTATPAQATPQPTATATPTPTPLLTATATAAITPPPAPTNTPAPAPTNTPIPSAVFVRSHTNYPQNGQYVVVGELVNGGAFDVFDVIVHGRFFDGAGLLIATAAAPAFFPKIEIERPSPFRLVVDVDPAAVNRYELSVTSDETSIVEYREPEVSDVAMVERRGRPAVVGELYNGHETALSSVVVAAAFYNEDGEVVDVAETILSEERISPGAVLPFEILVPDAGRAYSRLRVLAQGQVSLF